MSSPPLDSGVPPAPFFGQRAASGLLGVVQVILLGLLFGPEAAPQLAMVTLLFVSCVWFAEGLSQASDLPKSRRNIPVVERTPGVAFRLVGWCGLLGGTAFGVLGLVARAAR